MTADVEHLRTLARQTDESGDWARSRDLYAQIVSDPDATFWDRFHHARAVLYAGDLAQAEPLVSALAIDTPDKSALVMLQADLAERLEKYQDASALWVLGRELGASAYWSLFGEARAAFNLGRTEEASKLMTEALALPEREHHGEAFAAALASRAESYAGRLVRLNSPPNTTLAGYAFDDLLAELLARVRAGEDIARDDQRIAVMQELEEILADGLEVHENRFSIRRLSDLFNTFYNPLKHKPTLLDASILDLGSGSHNPLGLAFLFIMLGARNAISVDTDEVQNLARACRAMARSADVLLIDPARIIGDHPISRAMIERNLAGFDLSAMRSGCPDGIDSGRLQFRRESAARLAVKANSIDIVISNSFLEHVEDPGAVVAEMARVTVRGGRGIHSIDGTDHQAYRDPSRHPLQFLREGKLGMFYGCNRVRIAEFARLFERHGFVVEQIIPIRTIAVDDALRSSFQPPWRYMPPDDLSLAQAVVAVQRT